MSYKLYDEEIYFGKKTPWYDFFIDPGEATHLRKLIASDQGNPGQIFIRRAGPDGADPTNGFTRPEELQVGQNVGHIAWFGYNGEGWGNRLAQIHCRYQGRDSGSIHLTTAGIERMVITENGRLDLSGLADGDGNVKVIVEGRKGRIKIEWED